MNMYRMRVQNHTLPPNSLQAARKLAAILSPSERSLKKFSGSSDQLKRKDLKILTSEVPQIKSPPRSKCTVNKSHSYNQNFQAVFSRPFLNMNRQAGIRKQLRETTEKL